MDRTYSVKINPQSGQGLVEYSIILALLALVVVAVLVVLGPGVGNIFSESSKAFNTDSGESVDVPVEEPADKITISQVDYNGYNAHIDAQFDGGSDPSVTLTTSPGGPMQILDLHYHIIFPLLDCPCEVTITSSAGGSTTVMVGP
jgi:pilus assembly protein Flp/PilA